MATADTPKAKIRALSGVFPATAHLTHPVPPATLGAEGLYLHPMETWGQAYHGPS